MADRVITVTNPSVVTNDTLASYNNYSDQDGLLGSMTTTEAANGKTVTLSDGVVHSVTTKPVGTTNGEFTAVVSNAVTVDLSAPSSYEPWTDAAAMFALLSDSATPIDVSQASDGTGGRPMITTGADPTNSAGFNTFDGVNDMTKLASTWTSSQGVFTHLIRVKFNDFAPAATGAVTDGGGFNSAISILTTGEVKVRPAGLTLSYDIAAGTFTAGQAYTLAIRRDASNETFYRIDNGSWVSMGTTAEDWKVSAHGGRDTASAFASCSIGRRIILSEDLSLNTTKLASVQAWVEA